MHPHVDRRFSRNIVGKEGKGSREIVRADFLVDDD
jgi:hypothetical protein